MPTNQSIGEQAMKTAAKALDIAVLLNEEMQELGLTEPQTSSSGNSITVNLTSPHMVIALNSTVGTTYNLPNPTTTNADGYRYKFIVTSSLSGGNVNVTAAVSETILGCINGSPVSGFTFITTGGGSASVSGPSSVTLVQSNAPTNGSVTDIIVHESISVGSWFELIYVESINKWVLTGQTVDSNAGAIIDYE